MTTGTWDVEGTFSSGSGTRCPFSSPQKDEYNARGSYSDIAYRILCHQQCLRLLVTNSDYESHVIASCYRPVPGLTREASPPPSGFFWWTCTLNLNQMECWSWPALSEESKAHHYSLEMIDTPNSQLLLQR